MKPYQYVSNINSNDKINEFLINHIQNNSQEGKNILDFLLLQHTKVVAVFMRKNKIKYADTDDKIANFTNPGFTRQYILWLLYDAPVPIVNNIYDHHIVINAPKDFPTPKLVSIQQILSTGTAKTIAELLFKSRHKLLNKQNFIKQSRILYEDDLQSELLEYNVLLDSRVILKQFEAQFINASPIDVAEILQEHLPIEQIQELINNFNFTSDQPVTINKCELYQDNEIILQAYNNICNLISSNCASIEPDLLHQLENISLDIIQSDPSLFSKFISLTLNSTSEVLVFNHISLQVDELFQNKNLLKKNSILQQISTSILDLFLQDKFLLSKLLSTVSPQVIMILCSEHYPQIDIPYLILLRTYQDGPQFINSILQESINLIQILPFEILYFILEFSRKLIWLTDDLIIFQQQSYLNTFPLLENFVTIVNEHYSVNIQHINNLSQQHPFVLQSSNAVLLFLKSFQFNVNLVSKNLFSSLLDESEINNATIVRQVLVDASELIASDVNSIQIRAQTFQFILSMIQTYDLLLSPVLQSNEYMQESGWNQLILQNIIKAINLFITVDSQVQFQIIQIENTISQITIEIDQISKQIQLLSQQSIQNNYLQQQKQIALISQLKQKKYSQINRKNQLLKNIELKKQYEDKSAQNQQKSIEQDMKKIQSCIIQFLDIKQVQNKPYLFNLIKLISQQNNCSSMPSVDADQFQFVVQRNIAPKKIMKEVVIILNKIVPATAFKVASDIAVEYPHLIEYIAQFVLLDRLIQDQSQLLLNFMNGLLSITSQQADVVIDKLVLPLLRYIYPRFFHISFTVQNQHSINLQELASDKIKNSQITFQSPKSNRSLMQITLTQIAHLLSALLSQQQIYIQTPLQSQTKLMNTIIYYQAYSIDILNGLTLISFTQFIRITIQNLQFSKHLAPLFDNANKIQYFILNQYKPCNTYLLDTESLQQFKTDIQLIINNKQFEPQFFQDSTFSAFYQNFKADQYILKELDMRLRAANIEFCQILNRHLPTLQLQLQQFFMQPIHLQQNQIVNEMIVVPFKFAKITYFSMKLQQIYVYLTQFRNAIINEQFNSQVGVIIEDFVSVDIVE
ncbi:hypothetical protein SS50377_24444 [Spironucleus salmonicida]|uniref:Uncharacterized protein n=1 Tax=Spironucleus salmonicida TaxID=348837 RepID=V6LMU4_9EUKA|nr:hypothetical protein SS50377_24444 [Spironucleus salmonicida]|eukprot:EST46007.1 hypothetical protein SS50377_13993 [Spironucleus salmonicida]